MGTELETEMARLLDCPVGSVVLVAAKRPNWFARMVRYVCDSVHEHDEIICVREGKKGTANANGRRFEFVPLSQRLMEAESKYDLAVYRWATPATEDECWKTAVNAAANVLLDMRIPYDWRGVITIGRNVLRSWIPFLRPIVPHSEGKVWCTESVFLLAQVDRRFDPWTCGEKPVPKQPLPAPIHIERLIQARALLLEWESGGLHDRIMSNPQARP